MNEVITEAIVLDKEDLGEYDSRIFLYTKDLGKIIAKATSVRKITSKLASHLEPLSYITARLVSKRDSILDGRGFQLIDALRVEAPKSDIAASGQVAKIRDNDVKLRSALQVVHFISRAVPDGIIDHNLWDFLYGIIMKGEEASIRGALGFLGINPDFANCELCSAPGPEYFYPNNNMFVCRDCAFASRVQKLDFIKV